ncbi:unnamed protein product [Fraxinus pennsylvanica]|uniref:protein-serine/threonine phosphatase n=1 Tax=Fraxinus pennsylvanica TaxID=56036 RepID=A0AAD2EBN0_9LAMI|nr:unnamed protein product [Fraxinus pennsylvanica]
MEPFYGSFMFYPDKVGLPVLDIYYYCRMKRERVDTVKVLVDPPSSNSPKKNTCTHSGQTIDDESGVAFEYIHKRLANDEIVGLRDKNFKNLLHHKKLHLVLDLDHTLLNSTCIFDIEEKYLKSQQDTLQELRLVVNIVSISLFHFSLVLFEMYIYTMGKRSYALEMAKLLDPENIYFPSRVITKEDCTEKHRKGIDVVLGKESAILILDYTKSVILILCYHFFASSCKESKLNSKSLSLLRCDGSETDGALATVLKVLQRIHVLFFGSEHGDNLERQDMRQPEENFPVSRANLIDPTTVPVAIHAPSLMLPVDLASQANLIDLFMLPVCVHAPNLTLPVGLDA